MKPVFGIETHLAWKIKDIHQVHANLAQMVHGAGGLYMGQPRILITIKELEGASQKEIADHLHVTPASLAMSLKRLQKAGFIERHADSKDTRINKIHLAPRGQEVIESCRRQMVWIDQQMMAGFSDHEKEQLAGYLDRLHTNLSHCQLDPGCRIQAEADTDPDTGPDTIANDTHRS